MSHVEPPAPTLLCRAWAALKLLQEGQHRAAEDELAIAFGFINIRIEHDGKLLCKMVRPINLTPEQELEFYTKCQAIVEAQRPVTK